MEKTSNPIPEAFLRAWVDVFIDIAKRLDAADSIAVERAV